MNNFEFRKDDDGLWNKKLTHNEVAKLKIDNLEHASETEYENKVDFRRKAGVFEVVDKTDDKIHDSVNELEEIIFMMKKDPTVDPEVLKKMEEELAEEKEKRESIESRVLEKEDEASVALQKRKNLLN